MTYIKTISLIVISALTFVLRSSYCVQLTAAESNQECNLWNKFCRRARSQNNKHFNCVGSDKDSVIYYYEPQKMEWDEARQVCSLKFDGSHYADLVQLTQGTIDTAEGVLKQLNVKSGTEIATSGVCCMRKLDNNRFGTICEWLPTGKPVDHYTDPNVKNKCTILTFNYDGTNLNELATQEKSSSEAKSFLCGFNIPDGCRSESDTTTTTTTTTTTGKTQTSSTTTTQTEKVTPTSSVIDITTQLVGNIDKDLETINKTEIKPTNLLEISEMLKKTLNENIMEKNTSLILTMHIVSKIEQQSKYLDKNSVENFTVNMIESMGKVLDAEQAWEKIDDPDDRVRMSSNILRYIQNSGFNLSCNSVNQTDTEIIKPNIVVKTFALDFTKQIDFKVIGFHSSITIPEGIAEPPLTPGCKRKTGVGSMFDKLSRYLSTNLDDEHEINSNIVAFSIENRFNSTQLPARLPPIKIVVVHNSPLQFGDKVECVYWDFNQMNWSSNGCQFQQINSNRKISICECNHLTNFAALMDVSGRETDTKIKDILTKVCCGLSIVCLVLTIGFLTLVRALRNRRNNITSNLCICLLVVNLLVVFGMDSTDSNGLCQTVAAFLLYFILCSFSWMLMEGYHLYQMIVLVFSNIGHLKLIYLYAIGYGAPLLIALSAMLGIGFKNLKETDSYFCWISSPSHPYRVWSVAGPATVAILANGLIMYLALREAFSAKVKKKLTEKDFTSSSTNISEKLSQSLSWIKGFISLVVLLGITWISFVLYIHEFGNFFSYIFIILNGLQGVFIFVFQILLNEKARSVVRKTCHKRLPSRYLSSLYRTTSTNVFTSMRSKSFSRDKSTSDNTVVSNNGTNLDKRNKKSNDRNNSSIASHRSQSISMDRIRNASNSILF